MGSGSSRPTSYVPFPTPELDGDRTRMASTLSRWTLNSMAKRSKKGKDREKFSDLISPTYPTPTPATMSYFYPQMPPTYPTYYTPVPMAVVQPIPGTSQQPVLAMPQGYVPMVSYQTSAAPVQPSVVPAPIVRPITSMQMPAPASAPVSAPVFATASMPHSQMPHPYSAPAVIPQPAPAPPGPSAPPQMPQHPVSGHAQMPQPHPNINPTPVPQSSAPTQMPQPHYVHDDLGPVIPIPSSPIADDPVIPPPPIAGSEPRQAPDSARPRFTDFYRSADPPPSRRASVREPVRPPTAGPAGRTPFAPPVSMPTPTTEPTVRMPTPGAIPRSNNPLPAPPADIWDTLPYRQVLQNLPTDVATLLDLGQRAEVLVSDEPIPRPSSRLGTLFGSTSRRDKGKGTLRGLFRSRSTSGHDVLADIGPSSGSRHGHGRSQTMTTVVIPPPGATMDMPVPTQGPPIKFDHTGEYAGFVNHSNHRVMYQNKMYPTALHLLEAMKFTHQPQLQERIRTCKDVNDMYPLSASFQEHVRPDWGQAFLKTMEDVLYLKFKQHPSLRALLLGTGLSSIIYADVNEYWGEGVTGGGTNELGKALVRVRERLRLEGER